MKARKLDRRVLIYASSSQSDGYGGKTPTEILLTETWAHIETNINATRYRDLGISELGDSVVLTIRRRTDINLQASNLYIKHKGVNYMFQQISDSDVEKSFIRILATKELKAFSITADAPGTGFPYTFTFQL